MAEFFLPAPAEIAAAGKDMHDLMRSLYPLCRSITGDGARKTLALVKQRIPLELHEVPSGTPVFDWTVPKEWNIKDAYVKAPNGERIIDFQKSNLHVLNYSTPIRAKMTLQELKQHLFTLPDHPDWVPYLTSYYKEQWGFCLSQRQLDKLQEGTYEVLIDSELKDGSLSYGEFVIKGETEDEVLLSTYTCHPSTCNDNLSGVVLVTKLAQMLAGKKLRYTYRFLFVPETIGVIAWLARNEDKAHRIKAGLVVTCVGDPGMSTYKKSRKGDSLIDRAVQKVLADSGAQFKIIDFSPGSDERQYCSPGFDLPVGSLMRTPYCEYPQYHTSADDLNFVTADALADTLNKYLMTVHALENDKKFLNLVPKCEPRLGPRGLYRSIGGQKDREGYLDELTVLWVLNLSDGKHSLLDIAIRSGRPIQQVTNAARALHAAGLLKELGSTSHS
jgi:aminopeptidase-like protein